jgi:hypothetical protein
MESREEKRERKELDSFVNVKRDWWLTVTMMILFLLPLTSTNV